MFNDPLFVIGFALHMPTFIYNYFADKINNILGLSKLTR